MIVRRVRHASHPRGDLGDSTYAAEFKLFSKRPLATVTDEELLQYYRPEMTYLNCDADGKAYKD